LVRVRLPDKLSEHDCLLFISFFNFWISQHNCAGVGHAKAAACRCGWVVSNMGLGTGLAGGFTYIRCESAKRDTAKWKRPPNEAALPDIGRATATVCLGIADATPTTAANEIACRHVG
jgi:hypothetical protein